MLDISENTEDCEQMENLNNFWIWITLLIYYHNVINFGNLTKEGRCNIIEHSVYDLSNVEVARMLIKQ